MDKDGLCLTGRHLSSNFHERFVGMDSASGRFGEVSVLTCRHCGRLWLRYFWEHEGFAASGRWGSGLVTTEIAVSVTTDSALRTLEALSWYFIGGSYLGGGVRKVRGPVFLE